MKELKSKFWHLLLSSPNSFTSRKVAYLQTLVEEMIWKDRLKPAQETTRNTIPTYTTEEELRALYLLASGCPRGASVLEIGSYLGASSRYLAAGLAAIDGHLYCVDTWQNQAMLEEERDTFSQFLTNTEKLRNCITPVRKRSSELEYSDINQAVSLVFIDGDHSYEAVKLDFERVQGWLTENGIIAFHDFSNPEYEGVSRVLGEALASGNWTMLGKAGTLAWIQRSSWKQPHWHQSR